MTTWPVSALPGGVKWCVLKMSIYVDTILGLRCRQLDDAAPPEPSSAALLVTASSLLIRVPSCSYVQVPQATNQRALLASRVFTKHYPS